MKRFQFLIKKSGGLLALVALVAAKFSVTQACFIVFHQPKVPERLNKLKNE